MYWSVNCSDGGLLHFYVFVLAGVENFFLCRGGELTVGQSGVAAVVDGHGSARSRGDVYVVKHNSCRFRQQAAFLRSRLDRKSVV